ncbi:hypothetical protein DFA_07864 [Cavenderia fasciculata]|uniref:Uncharacterized protein n=1 Tax=Cavenderia fasciculata TaxID=261658 RepID=F4Q3R8_CACFS|nr:uncharacterized protein DFA_07864 [Cavenderia fasciculata]EGG16884.1 hypothetical protein DFA_07864 [Cavenderia fasciculata]|eukprot:XP_004355358.1 hypothetical protein DFA_07864 [Cavenderia fasciculata]
MAKRALDGLMVWFDIDDYNKTSEPSPLIPSKELIDVIKQSDIENEAEHQKQHNYRSYRGEREIYLPVEMFKGWEPIMSYSMNHYHQLEQLAITTTRFTSRMSPAISALALSQKPISRFFFRAYNRSDNILYIDQFVGNDVIIEQVSTSGGTGGRPVETITTNLPKDYKHTRIEFNLDTNQVEESSELQHSFQSKSNSYRMIQGPESLPPFTRSYSTSNNRLLSSLCFSPKERFASSSWINGKQLETTTTTFNQPPQFKYRYSNMMMTSSSSIIPSLSTLFRVSKKVI